ncbi:hypothetical protein [Neobacillus sp. NPDC093127]|uniref:hypothetical protein n=1 Tax=Neobacillus sp. NPDC093127 TaxID=3364296 RepID=UPI0037F54B64
MIEGKGLGGKRINRINASFTNKEDGDIQKLATACNMKPAELVWILSRRCLYDPVIVDEMQKEYCTQSAYKIVLVNGEYILRGREDL